MSKSDLESDLAKVKGLGSAKSGADHWWMQRMTAVAVALLSFFVVLIVLKLTRMSFEEARQFIGNPLVGGTLILFIIAAFYHAALGMQEVIVDYVHGKGTLLVAIVLNKLLLFALAAFSVLAILTVMMKGFGA